ncbi:MAG: QVPTGV class sortase B protein-sorting domain-containing protein [Tissierellia bacterium]|nr:QVPTGV class sortase B protein-sorting domain-containing protein [Tissierellia bacterium]
MKKLLKSLLVLALVFALVMPTALAANPGEVEVPTAITEVGLSKVYQKIGEDAYFNGETLEFNISSVLPTTNVQNLEVHKGVEGMLTFSNKTTKLTKDLKDDDFLGTQDEKVFEYKLTDKLIVNPEMATAPGLYGFKVTETNSTLDGVTNDETLERLVYVGIAVNKNGEYIVESIIAGDNEKANLDYTNKFETNNVTITKVTTGSQGDRNKEFPVEITVEGQEHDKYTVYVDDTKQDATYTTGEVIKVKVKNNTKIEIRGLTKGDSYSIKEKDLDGYVSSLGLNADVVGESKVLEDQQGDLEVINTLEGTIPTGVIETVAPFALMIVIALGFAVVYFRKREIEA